MSEREIINQILAQKHIAVAGVSRNTKKFGYIVYDHLKKHGYQVYPLNPNLTEVDGNPCYASVSALPPLVTALVTVTKPEVTRMLVKDAATKGINLVWLQQGSEDSLVMEAIRDAELSTVSKRCIMMFVEPVKSIHGFHRFIMKMFGKYPK